MNSLFPPSRFTADLIDANGLDPEDFQGWAFHPGMLFGAPEKWWGDLGPRDFPHEGLDFCLYRNRAGKVIRLGQGTRIPAIRDGRVKALFTDYLGQAVVLEHESFPGPGKGISVYAHTLPEDGLRPGVFVREGEVIAAFAGTGRSKSDILPHLHLSLGEPSSGIVYEGFVWNRMRDPGQVSLLDPQDLLGGPWEVLDDPAPRGVLGPGDGRRPSSGWRSRDGSRGR